MKKRQYQNFAGLVVLVLFGVVVLITEIKKRNSDISIRRNRQIIIGLTTGCDKNIRSSMHTLHYHFAYKGRVYNNSKGFNKEKRGDICVGVKFFIELDSINPNNNNILLDSVVTNDSINTRRVYPIN